MNGPPLMRALILSLGSEIVLFAILDYQNFKNGRGAYDLTQSSNQLGATFADALPDALIRNLKLGDAIFSCNPRSPISWAVSYLAQSAFTHCAVISGPGTIVEASLDGVREKALVPTFQKGARYLALKANFTVDPRAQLRQQIGRSNGQAYAYREIFAIGAGIICGLFPPLFRVSYAADVLLTLIILDFPFLTLWHRPVLLWLFVPYVAVLGVLLFSWRFFRRSPPSIYIPDEVLSELRRRLRIVCKREGTQCCIRRLGETAIGFARSSRALNLMSLGR